MYYLSERTSATDVLFGEGKISDFVDGSMTGTGSGIRH